MSQAIRRALLSVSNKEGLVDFARGLRERGVEILSTGGTASQLRCEGIDVVDVSAVTGFPEIMDGRVKTLHPKIHGALLGRRGLDEAVMAEHGIEAIDLLAVNLYPFAATVARPGCTFAEAVENIDIGGPAMMRAAAKNHARVTVVVDPLDYGTVLAEVDRLRGSVSEDTLSRTVRSTTRRSRRISPRPAARRATSSPTCSPPSSASAPTCATVRTRTSRPRSTSPPSRREIRSAARRCCRARHCRTTTSPTPTRRSSACASSTRRPA
jgi:hypothetical protein